MARKFTSEQLAVIAWKRFAPLNRGQQAKTYTTIIEELANHPDPSLRLANLDQAALSNALRDAIASGMVTVSVQAKPSPSPQYRRNVRIERQLLEAFSQGGLRTALVLDLPIFEAEALQSGVVSKALGEAFGDFLSDARVIQDEDRIGIGSGRAVFYACEQVRMHRRLLEEGVTLYSLTGDFGKRLSTDENRVMDADDNLTIFAQGIVPRCVQEKLRTLAVLPTDGRLSGLGDSWMSHLLPEKNGGNSLERPKSLLVGAGVLNRKWVFYDALLRAPDKDMENLMTELHEEVMRVAQENATLSPAYMPVGDVACHLVFLEAPNAVLSKEQAERIKSLIAEVNYRLASPSHELLTASKLWLLGGATSEGPTKARILHHALRNYSVDCLTTDSETATAILELESQLR